MTENFDPTISDPTICRFYRFIPDAPPPARADSSADGMVPVRGLRHCAPLTSASAFGWYIYPPLDFTLYFDGREINWTYSGAEAWYPLRSAQYPGFPRLFEREAPDQVKSLVPTFLAVGREPGLVQIWSGLLASTAPGWALLSRAPVNIPNSQSYEQLEGMLQTEKWFGPLFTNIRLTRPGSYVEFNHRYPLFQVQPLLHQCYLRPSFEVLGLADLGEAEWDRYEATMRRNADKDRRLGHHAGEVRRDLRRLEEQKPWLDRQPAEHEPAGASAVSE